MTRKQCEKCPWKVSTDPHDIPDGYSEKKHCGLKDTIAEEFDPFRELYVSGSLRLMACHETPVGDEVPCVGWLMHQLGPGNNIGLRLAVHSKRISADVLLDGDQHPTFEDTLP
jgi:hypothetical protein